MDQLKILSNFSFGRVDAETDDKLVNCFIGTDILKYALSPQHTLLLGGKGSGKSAIFRILCEEAGRLSQFINVSFKELLRIPAFGLNSDEYLSFNEIKEINPQSIDDFKYFWQLYFCLKTSYFIINSKNLNQIIKKSNSPTIIANYNYLHQLLQSIGLLHRETQRGKNILSKIKNYILEFKTSPQNYNTKKNLNVNVILEKIDKILKETNSYAWILIDQVDLLYLDDLSKRNKAITALIQLIIEYSNRYTNINLKIFLRTDIFKELNIVNKSHLVSSSIELIWTEELILRMLLARAIYDNSIKQFCEHKLKEYIDVPKIISGDYDLLMRVFYTIFQPDTEKGKFKLHRWMIRNLTDGLGKMYPREFIHLSNQAVAIQKDLLKNHKYSDSYLISIKAVKSAFKYVSTYRCESFLYAEYPYLLEHFNKLKEFGYDTLTKEEFTNLFADLNPSGNDALLALYDTGLLQPNRNRTIYSATKYKIPDLYKYGFGLSRKR